MRTSHWKSAMSALEMDRKRLAAIGVDHLQRQLGQWLAASCGHQPDASQLPAWMDDAYQHGLLTQRATAGWVLACHTLGTETVHNDPELRHLLNQADLPAQTRSMLFEIWLANRHAPAGMNTLAPDQVMQQASRQLVQAYEESLPARAATARALDRVAQGLALATDYLLPSVRERLEPVLSGNGKVVLEHALQSLAQQLAVIRDDALGTALAQARHTGPRPALDAIPDAEPQSSPGLAAPAQLSLLRQTCLNLTEQLRRMAEHDVPAQCERCRQAVDDAEQHAGPAAMAALRATAARIDELEIMLSRGLPTTAASAAAAAAVAYLSCAQLTDDVVNTALSQALAACAPSRIGTALSTLPGQFPDQHAHRPVQPPAAPVVPQRAGLRAALAQAALFDLMHMVATLCPTLLTRAQSLLQVVLHEACAARPAAGLEQALRDTHMALQPLHAALNQGTQGLPDAIRALQSNTMDTAQRDTLLASWEPLRTALEALAELRIDHPAATAAPRDTPLHAAWQAVQACADMGRLHGLQALALAQESLED